MGAETSARSLRRSKPQPHSSVTEHVIYTLSERDDVILGTELAVRHPALGARDLCHLASCQRRGVTRIQTFDRALRAAADALR